MRDVKALASWMDGASRHAESAGVAASATCWGVATGASSGGYVNVAPDGETVVAEGEVGVDMPCVASVAEGDRVMINVTNGAPTVIGPTGWGDAAKAELRDFITGVERNYVTTVTLEETESSLRSEVAESEQTVRRYASGLVETESSNRSTAIEQTAQALRLDITEAQDGVDTLSTMVRAYGSGVLVAKAGQSPGALVNADGSFDVVALTWSGNAPTVGNTLARLARGSVKLAMQDAAALVEMCAARLVITGRSVAGGMQGFEISTTRTLSGEDYTASLSVGIDEGGIPRMEGNALRVVLYENTSTSGETGTVTTYQTLGHGTAGAGFFRKYRLYCRFNAQDCGCIDVWNPNAKNVNKTLSFDAGSGTTQVVWKTWAISGATVTPVAYGAMNFRNNTCDWTSQAQNSIGIYRIEGWYW